MIAARPLQRWLVHRTLRWLLALHAAAVRLARRVGPQAPRPASELGFEILVTGTFYSDNWLVSHLRPLAAALGCARVRMVAVRPVPPMEKVEAVYPPQWVIRTLGTVPARLVTFVWTALRTRPHVVGGFHLLVNGLVAAVVAPLVGARSLYFCVGGPREVIGGGVWSDNRLFDKQGTPDPVVERRLIRAVGAFDLVITMGPGAVSFFRENGVSADFYVVPGAVAVEGSRASTPSTDVIWVGRLAPIKRVDLLLRALALVAQAIPVVKTTIVGDGDLRRPLERLARELGIDRNVSFVGHRVDVGSWLSRAKVFVLTSDSEGLSLALMEAMSCGLPAVVSDVGELSWLVEHGVNGYLVHERTPEAYAQRIAELLTNEIRRERFAEAALRSGARFRLGATAALWDAILGRLRDRDASSVARGYDGVLPIR